MLGFDSKAKVYLCWISKLTIARKVRMSSYQRKRPMTSLLAHLPELSSAYADVRQACTHKKARTVRAVEDDIKAISRSA